MADTQKPASPVSPLRESDGPPESPTTAKALDFDSDQEGGNGPPAANKSENAPNPPPKDEAPPTKPPRPVSAQEQAEHTLREAFPTIDASVVKAVLMASRGQVEPAFNALLGMTDPEAQREPDPPAMPPRPPRQQSLPQNQVDADEMYARQLQEHYSNAARSQQPQQQRRPSNQYNEELQGSRVGRPGSNPDPDDVPWRSFFDDDLPEIRDNIKKGFFETQTTVNKWITTFRKRLDGEEEEGDTTIQPSRPSQDYGGGQPYGRRSQETRRSADLQRYDADPQVIGDDFSKLDVRDGEAPPRMSSRPLANPNLFKPASALARKSSSPGSGRKVSFQDGPPEEIQDMYSAPTTKAGTTVQPPSSTKPSKWQPLSSVEPSPVTDNDPFSLGDSDDDKDAKPITLKDDEEDAQVKKATDEAIKESIGDTKVDGKK